MTELRKLEGKELDAALAKIIKANPISPSARREPWDLKDEEILRKLYYKVPVEVVAAQLGRTKAAVRTRASQMLRDGDL